MDTPETLALEETLKDSVVKIYTVYNKADYYRPWQMEGQDASSGSGCIIAGERILTNAHVVADQTFIQVKRAGSAEKYVARLEIVAHDCDLALLRVDDPAFFAGAKPVEFDTLPRIKDKVAVYGFPVGGTKLAITEGVISRVENLTYSHSLADLLCCQIDAPINPGSSGGPVIHNRKIVGVAFQGNDEGQNIGYMVPAPVVKRFLDDIHDGRYRGVPALGVSYQNTENRAIREKYRMRPGDSGILVNKIDPESSAYGILEPEDVILSIDGFDIANDGTIEFRKNERTVFFHAIQSRFLGDTIPMEILRDGKVLSVEVKLSMRWSDWHLVPRPRFETMPTYYIAGGLVFSPVTTNLLMEWSDIEKAPRELSRYYYEDPQTDRREVVTLIQILSHEINTGYDGMIYTVIRSVNGRHVNGIRDLVEAFEAEKSDFHTIVNEEGYKIVLSRAKAKACNREILKRYHIRSDRSADLRKC